LLINFSLKNVLHNNAYYKICCKGSKNKRIMQILFKKIYQTPKFYIQKLYHSPKIRFQKHYHSRIYYETKIPFEGMSKRKKVLKGGRCLCRI
jgi:hypothetical protein